MGLKLPNSIPGETTCQCGGPGTVKYQNCKFALKNQVCKVTK